ncbi:MAG: hypothetical protein KatS3mg035_0354 [Bacteroidia bacterium]|nr:MAG: hypothetical protein KatS3mg035_0354 [Bacteroidia bacterium]
MFKGLVFILLFFVHFLEAQIGSWNILNVKYELDKSWSYVGEAQLRSLLFYNHFHYYEYKGFINKKWNDELITSLGIGSYQTFKEGGNFMKPKNADELRISPQIITIQNFHSIQLEHRYRMELRFINKGYKNRFRYRLNLKYSFPKIPVSCFLNNEIFFGTQAPYFERNRSSFVIQYKISHFLSYQLGFLYQFDYKINDETGRNFIVIGALWDLKLHQ